MLKIKVENVDAEFAKLRVLGNTEIHTKAAGEVADMVGDLAAATPVDTGLARASWSSTETLPGVHNVTNTTDYIQYLNEGSSQQAPARFIESIALNYGDPVGTIVDVIPEAGKSRV